MKPFLIILQICFALLGIFALGIWVGRSTVPAPVAAATASTSMDSDTASTQAIATTTIVTVEGGGTTLDPRAQKRATRRAFRRYDERLMFTADQREKLRPLFSQIGLQMSVLPKRSEARHLMIEEFHQQIRSYLTPDQAQKLDRLLEESRVKKGLSSSSIAP